MKEARHPNIVQYIGLSRSPGADGRIYIISEFVGPNVRSFIADTRKPFPWRLRISFATDIARALAYLHARNCLHRDLKPENLLITDNERVKMCDFGFARIAARNEEEMRRMSYCGTDGYMSPEILLGLDFSLPSDIFSLGVIFAEIASRHLVDSTTFKRSIPSFTLDPEEVRSMASEGCPDRLIQLAIDCTQENPAHRPDMRKVLMRLRLCEQEIIAREEAEEAAAEAEHAQFYSVGSIRAASSLAAVLGTRKSNAAGVPSRPNGPPRLPSFQGQVQVGGNKTAAVGGEDEYEDEDDDDHAEKEVEEALAALEKVGVAVDPTAPDLGVGVNPARPTQLVSTIKGSHASAKKSSHLFHGANGGDNKMNGANANSNTFKVSGYGNPWWSDEDERQSLVSIPSSWVRRDSQHAVGHIADASNASGRQPLLGGGNNSGEGEQYSTSVVRSSRLSAVHGHGNESQTPLGSRLSVLTARNGENGFGSADSENGSTMTVRRGESGSSVGQHPNVDIAELAENVSLSSAAVGQQPPPVPLKEGMNLSPAHKNTLTRHAGGGGTASAPQSFIAEHGRMESGREPSLTLASAGSSIFPAPIETVPVAPPPRGLRSRLFGRSSESPVLESSPTLPSVAEDKNSTIRASGSSGFPAAIAEEETGPTPLYHRFTLVKNSTRRPAHMTAGQQAAAAARGVSGGPGAGSLLPPAVMLSNALARCWVCGKRIGWKPFCECDDCPMRTHVGCSQFALPNCQEIVFPSAEEAAGHPHHHPRAPSVQPAVYASNSGPRWHHAPALRSSSNSSSSSGSGSASGGGGDASSSSNAANGGAGRKTSGASSSTSTPRSSSRSRPSSLRSDSVDVGKQQQQQQGQTQGQQGPSRAAETLAAYAAAAGWNPRERSEGSDKNASESGVVLINAKRGSASGDGRTPLGQQHNRPLSPQPQQRSSSMDNKIAKLIKGARRKSSSASSNAGGIVQGGTGTGAASPVVPSPTS